MNMVDKRLRYPKERLLSLLPLRFLHAIHPTVITLIACGVGVAAGIAAWQQAYMPALLLWLLNRLLDGIDGTVARLHGKQSDLGAYLDIVLDMVVYAVIPAGLALGADTPAGYMSLALLLASFYVNSASWMYLAALLEKRKHGAAVRGELTTVTMPGGLIEGAETIVFYTLFLLFPSALVSLFMLMAALVLATTIQRIVWAAHNL